MIIFLFIINWRHILIYYSLWIWIIQVNIDKEWYIERMRSIDLTEDRILSTQLMKNHNQEEDQKIEVIKSIPKTIVSYSIIYD